MVEMKEWDGFEGRLWKEEINVRQFIQDNYTPYEGDESFLEGPTEATDKLWGALQKLQKEERAKGGVLDMDTKIVSSITSHDAGYIDESLKDLEKVVGLQTDKPLKRAFMPYGGIKMAVQACETYGYEVDPEIKKIFTVYHKTHNTAVFDAYTPEMLKARHNKIMTGLPDTYGRGRIVGDYRRVALYGIDFLIEEKKKDKLKCGSGSMKGEVIRLREEIAEQIRALENMKKMAEIYGFDISEPAKNAKEAIQWIYFGYLAAIKTQNGAAMSVGRVSTFLDIYFERDLKKGIITEQEVQELSDVQAVWLKCIRNRQNRWKVRLLIHCRESLDLRLKNRVMSARKIVHLFSVFQYRRFLYVHQLQDGILPVLIHHGLRLPDRRMDTDIHFCLLDRFQVLGKKQ